MSSIKSKVVQIFIGAMLFAFSSQAQEVFYLTDHLGSTRVVTNEFGAEQARYAYYPFGFARGESGVGILTHRYTGGPLDREASLYYLQARYYDPALGLFVSVDPILETGQPYAYARNNPVRVVDTTGLSGEDKIDDWDLLRLYYYKGSLGGEAGIFEKRGPIVAGGEHSMAVPKTLSGNSWAHRHNERGAIPSKKDIEVTTLAAEAAEEEFYHTVLDRWKNVIDFSLSPDGEMTLYRNDGGAVHLGRVSDIIDGAVYQGGFVEDMADWTEIRTSRGTFRLELDKKLGFSLTHFALNGSQLTTYAIGRELSVWGAVKARIQSGGRSRVKGTALTVGISLGLNLLFKDEAEGFGDVVGRTAIDMIDPMVPIRGELACGVGEECQP
ncbi:MAG: RHS repeat-associated core domain-containing protein [Deltaproteobacteria bacterium]|nr:RHS repeat-associated core domain-containing protein [Deltaproteobacteria bacterium]